MRKWIANIVVLAALVAGTCGWALAQSKEEPPDRAIVPLSNPAKPAKIEVSVMRGSITVKTYQGKEVVVEARVREKSLGELYAPYPAGNYALAAPPVPPSTPAPATAPAPMAVPSAKELRKQIEAATQANNKELQAALQAGIAANLANQEALARRVMGADEQARALYDEYFQDDKKRREEREKKRAGMKQLSGSTSGLEIEEDDNVVQISVQSWKAATDLLIQVPVTTSLEIRSSMDGAVAVEGVSGEIDINNINGPVTLTNVSGNTLVHTVHGDIEVVLARIAADKPLSFSSMTGDIDVTLPADVKASLKMKSEQGEIYTDFDMNVGRKASKAEATEKAEPGKYRVTFDRSLIGLVNGGGQEISFNTYGGDIYIRKKK